MLIANFGVYKILRDMMSWDWGLGKLFRRVRGSQCR